MMNKVNIKLWAAIRDQGLTQADFARIVGDDPSVVSRIINCRWNIDQLRKERYSKALKLKPDDLFQD
jgi:transcriptional regulator with XRE-family HTH domain